jgi:hypothetical protein
MLQLKSQHFENGCAKTTRVYKVHLPEAQEVLRAASALLLNTISTIIQTGTIRAPADGKIGLIGPMEAEFPIWTATRDPAMRTRSALDY